MSLKFKERLNRRTAIRYGLGSLAGLALALRSEIPAFAQNSLTSRAAQIGVAGYPGPEIPEGPTSILQDMLTGAESDDISWGSMKLVRELLLAPNSPIAIDTPTERKDLFTANLTQPHIIQAAPLSLVVARMDVEGEGAGFIHGLPDSQVTDPSKVVLTMVEMRRGRELWAIVRMGNDFQKPPLFDEQIDDLPEGPKALEVGMLFTNGGNTFAPLGTNGAIKTLIDLPYPTAEIGSESIIAGYRFNKTPKAIVTGIAMAVPQIK